MSRSSTREFHGPIEGYVVNFLQQHYWRIQASMTMADAIQEAAIVFLRCDKKYPKVEDKHFMALFKTAWARRFTDLANQDTTCRKAESMPVRRNKAGQETEWEPIGETENAGYLRVMITEAPTEVRQVLALFLNAPQELLEAAFNNWRRRGRYNAGGSKMLAQLLGHPADRDVVKLVIEYFSEGPR